MDQREKKTVRSIKNAFLQLRAKKPLERITVKELSQAAEISKATFYLHYRDIYDLSHQLQYEVIQDILNSITQADTILFDMPRLTRLLFHAFYAHQSMIDILFSGEQAAVLPISLERGMKEYAFRMKPEVCDDVRFNVLLSYQIHGGYHAYMENGRRFEAEQVIEIIDDFVSQVPVDANLVEKRSGK